MADDQTAQDLTPDDNGVTLNSDQIMELLRRAHDSTPPKPVSPPKSPFQSVQQPARPQTMQPAPQQPMQGPPANQPQPGKVLDQASGAYVSPQTAQNVAWTRQRGNELEQQDKQQQTQSGQQNTWQQIYSALRKQNPQATPQQLLMSMKQFKEAGAFDMYAKNAMGKTVEEQVYQSVLQSTGDRDAAEKAAAQYKQGGSLEELKARKEAMSQGTKEGQIAAAAPALAEKKANAARDTIQTIDTLDDHISDALKQINSGTAGVFGNLVKGIYQPAADLEATLGSIGSAVGFQQLQEMRKNSPTGAALGRVTNFEMEMLQSTLASLKQKQSPDQLKANLNTVKRISDKIRDSIEEDQKNGVTYGTSDIQQNSGQPSPEEIEAEIKRRGL